jgi:hypothetical protein
MFLGRRPMFEILINASKSLFGEFSSCMTSFKESWNSPKGVLGLLGYLMLEECVLQERVLEHALFICLKLVLQVLVVYTTLICSHFTLMKQKKNLVIQMFCQTIVEATQCCLKLWNQTHAGGTTSNDPPWMHWSSCRWLCCSIKTLFFSFLLLGEIIIWCVISCQGYVIEDMLEISINCSLHVTPFHI